jgi:2-dehydro-3-deoxyphosphogluconate aldolase/(4S)-4-hydroxy-2-oxoglutarate aldolase
MNPTLNLIQQCGIVAIVRLDDLSQAVSLTRALIDGGVNVIEFTLTNPDAIDVIRQINLPEINEGSAIIGAGSVITLEQTRQVIDAGAQFVVSPIVKQDVIDYCVKQEIPAFPGAFTPTEIQSAWEMGAAAVKVFPARSLGASYIKDVLAPLPHLRLIPTGGIGLSNLADFVRSGVFAVGVGSSLLDEKAISDGDWSAITQRAAEFVAALESAR